LKHVIVGRDKTKTGNDQFNLADCPKPACAQCLHH
jgi:hypothetical protein